MKSHPSPRLAAVFLLLVVPAAHLFAQSPAPVASPSASPPDVTAMMNESFPTAEQIAAASPIYVSREEVPEKALKDEREVAAAQIKGKPEAVVEKIVAGKVEKYYSTVCLMEQAFVKDANLTMKDIISSKIGELGENIVVRRFTRFAVGEGEAATAAPEQA